MRPHFQGLLLKVLTSWNYLIVIGLKDVRVYYLYYDGTDKVYWKDVKEACQLWIKYSRHRFHYVLSMGAVYSLFAAWYAYMPHLTGFELDPFYARLHFITFFVSSNLTFYPMHVLGTMGHPRRVFDYQMEYWPMHWLSTLGSVGMLWA